MALRIVKDRVKEASEEGSTLKDRMTAKEVWERLVEEMNGQLRLPPSAKTVKRWLDRWVEDGVLSHGKPLPVEGQRKPAPSYTLPPSCARALRMRNRLVSVLPRERLQENGSLEGHSDEQGGDVFSTEGVTESERGAEQTAQTVNGHATQPDSVSSHEIPVPQGDLGEEQTNGISKHTKEEPHGQRAPVQATPDPASEVDEADEEGRSLGAEVPRSQDADRSVLGDESPASVDDGRSPDHPDVDQPGSGVQPPVTWRDPGNYTGPEDDYGDAFDGED